MSFRNVVSALMCMTAISCGSIERCPKGDVCHVRFYNTAPGKVFVGESYLWPDTTLADLDIFTAPVPGGDDYPLSTALGWKNKISKKCPGGRIMFIVISQDTFDKYGLENVKSNYRIQKNYSLSADSLERMNWTIKYP